MRAAVLTQHRQVSGNTHWVLPPSDQELSCLWQPGLQAPDMPDSSVVEVLHTPWTKWGALLTCDLLPHQAEACQHIATLTMPELAGIKQVLMFAQHVHRLV